LEGVTLNNHQAIGGAGSTSINLCGGGGGGGGMGNNGVTTGTLNGGAGGGPNGGAGGEPGPQNPGAPGGVGGGGGCGDYSSYPKGVGGAGGFGGGAGGNSSGDSTSVSGGFGGGGNRGFPIGGGGAGMGGAVFNHGGTLVITNSTLSGNIAQGGASVITSGSGFGGAIFNRAGTVTVLNSTLAYNTVATSHLGAYSGATGGGALYSYADGGAATVNVTNSILSNSAGGSDAVNDGGTVSGSHNVIMSGSGFGGVTLSSDSPNLAALADNGGRTATHALVPPSPTLHNGTAVGAPTIDQRGVPRDTRPDIGAFELQATLTFADPAGLCGGNIPCFTTIGGAIGAALDGGTAVIYPATYNETALLNKTITVNVNGDVILNGSLIVSNGAFNAGSGNVTVNGDFTLSGGSFTAPVGLLDVTGATAVSGGTFTYTANGTIRERRSVSGLPTLTFPLTGITIAVTANTGLTGVQVTRHEQNHAGATTIATQTGRYWSLTPTGSGFTVNLTLPVSFTPDAGDRLCRHTAGPGYGWDCGEGINHSFTSNSVTRHGVTAFSDWVVGNNAGPTAVTLSSFAARTQPGGVVGLLAGLLVVGGGTAILRRRKR
jgi:hypothetical protein